MESFRGHGESNRETNLLTLGTVSANSTEKHVEKLFRDITTGMLRRKRNHGSLSDSDGDDEEARRRHKRRQFAKMQRALMSDERIKKIAEKPGSLAFLRTLEDREEEDDDMGAMEPEDTITNSQGETIVPATQQQRAKIAKHKPEP